MELFAANNLLKCPPNWLPKFLPNVDKIAIRSSCDTYRQPRLLVCLWTRRLSVSPVICHMRFSTLYPWRKFFVGDLRGNFFDGHLAENPNCLFDDFLISTMSGRTSARTKRASKLYAHANRKHSKFICLQFWCTYSPNLSKTSNCNSEATRPDPRPTANKFPGNPAGSVRDPVYK